MVLLELVFCVIALLICTVTIELLSTRGVWEPLEYASAHLPPLREETWLRRTIRRAVPDLYPWAVAGILLIGILLAAVTIVFGHLGYLLVDALLNVPWLPRPIQTP